MNQLINNEVVEAIKPDNADALASRCLAVLLSGMSLNRKTLDELGITANNASLHSLISILRNEQFIPIMSKRQIDATCNYYMTQDEIFRFKDPVLRFEQREEMKALVEEKRVRKNINQFGEFLDKLYEFPSLWRYLDYSQRQLEDIVKRTNALLDKKKGVN